MGEGCIEPDRPVPSLPGRGDGAVRRSGERTVTNSSIARLPVQILRMRGHSSTSSIKELRRELRQNQTEAEEILWKELRNRQLTGKKFRRQHSFGTFIVDFYCHEHLLVIELDGSVHNTPEARLNDTEREAILCDMGLTVMRFPNNNVLFTMRTVLEKILENLR